MNIGKIAEKWAKRWEEAKDDIVEAISDPEVQNKWKKNVLSPRAVKLRHERLKEAIENGLIEAGLEKVKPEYWASETARGIRNKTISEEEKEKYEENAKPYLEFIAKKKEEFDKLRLSGKAALDWWYENVSKKLHEMKVEKAKEVLAKIK